MNDWRAELGQHGVVVGDVTHGRKTLPSQSSYTASSTTTSSTSYVLVQGESVTVKENVGRKVEVAGLAVTLVIVTASPLSGLDPKLRWCGSRSTRA